jgi:hypothetical protein
MRKGDPRPEEENFVEYLGDFQVRDVGGDDYAAEQFLFVVNHPAFPEALQRFREDLDVGRLLEEGGEDLANGSLVGEGDGQPSSEFGVFRQPFVSGAVLGAATAGQGAMPYPVRSFCEEWGLPAITALELAAGVPVAEARPVALAVRKEPTEYVLRIPRPLTSARRKALEEWVKSLPHEPGPTESVWDAAGKSKMMPSPQALASIGAFKRWNAKEAEPAELWREALDAGHKVEFEPFHANLVAAWKRMREISPQRVRPDRPSKRRA